MENASQALIIAGAILLAILIIAIGMYIYNSAQATINDSISSMSTQEIEAFNNNFESYKGKQTGSQVSALVGRLIANSNTFQDEPGKVPTFTITKVSNKNTNCVNAYYNNADPNEQTNYITNLTTVKNGVENKHTYLVEFGYGNSGLIDAITVTYDID